MKTELPDVAIADQPQEESARRFGVLAKESQGRITKFRTRRGTLIYRVADRKGGELVYRDQFTYRVKVQGKQYYFTLDREREKAASLADEIAAFLEVSSHTIEQAIGKFSPNKIRRTVVPELKSPTVGELIIAYEQVANRVVDSTKRTCTGAIRRVAAFILGLKPFQQGANEGKLNAWRARVDALPFTSITPQKLEALRGSLMKAAGTNEIQRGKAVATANAIIRNAGCLCSPRLRPLYTDFALPDPSPFKLVGQLEERPHRYISSINIGALVKAARRELAKKMPAEFVVFVLSVFGGLRRKEIDRLIWDQIDFKNEHIWVRTTPYYRPKARNSESRVDCPHEVFEILRKFKRHSITPPFVIPGAGPENKVRCRPTFQNLYRWLRKKGIKEIKALHVLRKEAGSHIFALTGSTDQAAEFLRNDPRTAREYYLGRKDRLEVRIGGLAA